MVWFCRECDVAKVKKENGICGNCIIGVRRDKTLEKIDLGKESKLLRFEDKQRRGLVQAQPYPGAPLIGGGTVGMNQAAPQYPQNSLAPSYQTQPSTYQGLGPPSDHHSSSMGSYAGNTSNVSSGQLGHQPGGGYGASGVGTSGVSGSGILNTGYSSTQYQDTTLDSTYQNYPNTTLGDTHQGSMGLGAPVYGNTGAGIGNSSIPPSEYHPPHQQGNQNYYPSHNDYYGDDVGDLGGLTATYEDYQTKLRKQGR